MGRVVRFLKKRGHKNRWGKTSIRGPLKAAIEENQITTEKCIKMYKEIIKKPDNNFKRIKKIKYQRDRFLQTLSVFDLFINSQDTETDILKDILFILFYNQNDLEIMKKNTEKKSDSLGARDFKTALERIEKATDTLLSVLSVESNKFGLATGFFEQEDYSKLENYGGQKRFEQLVIELKKLKKFLDNSVRNTYAVKALSLWPVQYPDDFTEEIILRLKVKKQSKDPDQLFKYIYSDIIYLITTAFDIKRADSVFLYEIIGNYFGQELKLISPNTPMDPDSYRESERKHKG